ncbi:MAG: YHS domain-containing protein [Ignavibacteriales bacterium]|nr:MAG: YHS domain-containing protein [Ignavibacteriales bacterium]
MGDEVDPEVKTVTYNGKVYGFCCKGCIKKFSNNPEKYAAKLSEDGTKLIEPEKK